MQQGYAAVLGGINMDISGTPDTTAVPGASDPGRITLTPGGVGRNIAEDLVRLGCPVRMLTALGGDDLSGQLRERCRQAGIDLSLSPVFPEERASTYLCLNDEKGELVGAVSDMRVVDRLTPEVVAPLLPRLEDARLLVLDANLLAETLRYVAEHTTLPLFADPVSVKKAGRLRGCLSRCTLIKPNRDEAALLSGIPIRTDEDLPLAAGRLLELGVRQVIISLGARGCYWHDGTRDGILPCLPSPIVNTTGCGDSFLAACAVGFLEGRDLEGMARLGLAASAVTAGHEAAVSPRLCRETLDRLLNTSIGG